MSEITISNQLSPKDTIELCVIALNFFSPMNQNQILEILGREKSQGIKPLTVSDFFTYLEKTEMLKNPFDYGLYISAILKKLASVNVLQSMGVKGPLFEEMYYFFSFEGEKHKDEKRKYWIAGALGAEFIYCLFTPYLVQITGINDKGDHHAGTGILINSDKVLTCAHVITDMKLDETVLVCGKEKKIINCKPHDKVDVGLIEIENVDEFIEAQVVFDEPNILDDIYLMGYPKVPQIREAPLTIQKGEVNNINSTTFDGWRIFLFSAIARPGNSGGPIISHKGTVAGIVTRDLFAQTEESEIKTILPFYAGIPTSQIQEAIRELNDNFNLPT